MLSELSVVMMNEVAESTDMIGPFLRERKGFASETSEPLPQGVVEAFDVIGETAVFGNDAMASGRQDADIGLPLIGKANGTFSVDGRQVVPKGLGDLSRKMWKQIDLMKTTTLVGA